MKKRILVAVLGAIVLIMVVVLVRALTLSGASERPAPPAPIALDDAAVAERVAGALRFATVSHQGESPPETAEAWVGLHAYLAATYPRTYAGLEVDRFGAGVMLTWRGKDPALAPVVLCGHIDVVPAEDEGWTVPPFEGRVADGFVWGRGTLDDKGAVLSQLEAVELLLARAWQPQRTLIFAFGHDEEIGGAEGAAKMAAALAERLGDTRAHFVVDEGFAVTDGIVPGVDKPVAFIGLGEKGYVTFELSVEGQGGHSSMPPRSTPVGILARAITKLEDQPMPMVVDGTGEEMFVTLAPDLPFSQRLIIANLWLLRPVLKMALAGGDSTRAMLHTTTAPTMLQGAAKENQLPNLATGAVNFRIKPGDTIADVRAHIVAVVDDPRVKVEQLGHGDEPSPVSPSGGPGYDELERAISDVFPKTLIAPNISPGATDGRHYHLISPRVYRFVPMVLGPDDLKRIHGVNERVAVSDLGNMVRFYVRLLELAGLSGG